MAKKQTTVQDDMVSFSGVDLTEHKAVRLAVSGDVSLSRLETRLIDTTAFQRLRTIRQLGSACLVYPTALHTRFDHSLGTLDIAQQMIRAIRENERLESQARYISPEQELLIRLYALLHDIGHIPFGHTIEDEFSIFPRHDKDIDRLDFFLGEESELGRILLASLGKDLYGRLMRIFATEAGHAEDLGEDFFVRDLISNTICADLIDYLRRDAFFCNLGVVIDLRFLRHLSIHQDGKLRRAVFRLWKEGKSTPRRDVLNELIRLLDSRYLLGERVYFHHAKLISGAMLAGAVKRARDAGELTLRDLYEMGDDALLWQLCQSKEPNARRLARAYGKRQLWKCHFERDRATVQAEQQSARTRDVVEEIMNRFYRDPEARTAEEERIAALLGMDSGDVLFHCPDARMSGKIADLMVYWNGGLRPLRECTDDPLVGPKLSVILQSHETIWSFRAFLNPERGENADLLATACEELLTFDDRRRKRYETGFLTQVVERHLRQHRLGRDLNHDEYEKRIKKTIGQLRRKGNANESASNVETTIAENF